MVSSNDVCYHIPHWRQIRAHSVVTAAVPHAQFHTINTVNNTPQSDCWSELELWLISGSWNYFSHWIYNTGQPLSEQRLLQFNITLPDRQCFPQSTIWCCQPPQHPYGYSSFFATHDKLGVEKCPSNDFHQDWCWWQSQTYIPFLLVGIIL